MKRQFDAERNTGKQKNCSTNVMYRIVSGESVKNHIIRSRSNQTYRLLSEKPNLYTKFIFICTPRYMGSPALPMEMMVQTAIAYGVVLSHASFARGNTTKTNRWIAKRIACLKVLKTFVIWLFDRMHRDAVLGWYWRRVFLRNETEQSAQRKLSNVAHHLKDAYCAESKIYDFFDK